jgi:hypothetical protein
MPHQLSKTDPNHLPSTRDILTTMALINDAIAAFKLQDPDAQLSLQAISD